MARLNWSAQGERYFEAGVDQGVLYVDPNLGVAWNGLKSISESPSGGEARPYYYDGVKYLNISSAEEFEATIEAFSAPQEFAVCDGTAELQNGLFITQQRRKSFGLSYRTRLGNDVEGVQHAYKIHLVYNALAAPSERANASLGDSVDASSFSWQITTMAPDLSGHRPTAHFVVDSSRTDPAVLATLEDSIYGSTSNAPRLPPPSELITMFGG